MTEDDRLLGEQLKAAGIATAEDAANPEWKIIAFDAGVAVARRHANFTADEVFDIIEATGVTTHENRAFGGVMQRLAKAGVCHKTRTFPETRPSQRSELHNSPIQIWVSLILGSLDTVENPYENA